MTLSGKIRLVPVASVIAFHAEQKYVQMLHEVDGRLRESLIDEALKALEDEFADSFVRIHRSALVRRDAIVGLDRDDAGQYSVALRGVPEPLPVSRRHAAAASGKCSAAEYCPAQAACRPKLRQPDAAATARGINPHG